MGWVALGGGGYLRFPRFFSKWTGEKTDETWTKPIHHGPRKKPPPNAPSGKSQDSLVWLWQCWSRWCRSILGGIYLGSGMWSQWRFFRVQKGWINRFFRVDSAASFFVLIEWRVSVFWKLECFVVTFCCCFVLKSLLIGFVVCLTVGVFGFLVRKLISLSIQKDVEFDGSDIWQTIQQLPPGSLT